MFIMVIFASSFSTIYECMLSLSSGRMKNKRRWCWIGVESINVFIMSYRMKRERENDHLDTEFCLHMKRKQDWFWALIFFLFDPFSSPITLSSFRVLHKVRSQGWMKCITDRTEVWKEREKRGRGEKRNSIEARIFIDFSKVRTDRMRAWETYYQNEACGGEGRREMDRKSGEDKMTWWIDKLCSHNKNQKFFEIIEFKEQIVISWHTIL